MNLGIVGYGKIGRLIEQMRTITADTFPNPKALGTSLLNLGSLIANGNLKPAVAALHEEFFQELDPEVFA